jgi:heterotetrameric sarcosine oxidase gamma subunit
MAERAPPATMTPIAPFRGMVPLAHPARDSAPGIIATDRDVLGLATVAVRKAMFPPLAAHVRERFGIDLPRDPTRRETANGIAFAGIGPGTWLAAREGGAGGEWAALLTRELTAFASIADQSDGYSVLRLSGPRVLHCLAKLLPLDVHPRAFKIGDVASTLAFHMGVTLWRLDDAADGAPVFEIAVFRSLAGSFWHALSHSAAEFGLIMAPSAG